MVTGKEGKLFADNKKIKFFSVSVKDNINIENFINDLQINIENNNNNINNGINEIIYGNPSKEKYKVVVLGDSGIGSKTSFLNVVIKNQFDPNYPSSSGCVFSSKKLNLNNEKELTLDFWDTPGQKKYRSLIKYILMDIDCAILGYEVTQKESFESAKTFWLEYLKENSNVDLIYLVGNKIDLINQRQVQKNEANKYCDENNIRHFEISCKDNIGKKELLDDLTNQLIKK